MSSIFEKKDIVGVYNLTSTDKAYSSLQDNSVLKIRFEKTEESISPYNYARFCVITAEGVKVFAGVFIDGNGEESTVIQIPVIGQTINDLVSAINMHADVVAEVENSSGFISSSLLIDTAFTDSINGSWIYFSSVSKDVNTSYSLGRDVRFFLTSPEPLSEQNNITQSLGGYVSTNEIYGGVSLASAMSIYDKVIYLGQSVTSGFSVTDFQKNEYIQIDDEIIRISKWSGFTGYIAERNVFDTPLRVHAKGAVAREIVKNDFFDTNFSKDRKQYRCIAVKNVNASEITKDMKVFFGINSRNNLSQVRIAIEVPSSDYYSGASSSSGITAFSVSSLAGAFPDNHFVNAPIYFESGGNTGQTRLVKSFVSSTGTIEISERLPNYIATGDLFFIDTAPSSRTKSSGKKPTSPNVSEFFDANTEDTAISINVSGQRLNGGDLKPNDVVYIWIERSILESSDEFIGNRFALSLIYSKV
jgi:hypothetical protein